MAVQDSNLSGGALEDSEITKDGILDILNDEPDSELGDDESLKEDSGDEEADVDDAPKKKGKDKDYKEVDEENEEDLELKDKDDEEIEFKDIPRRQEILKAYPDIFKKFPGIEHAIYREQAYAEVFPTVKDAKAALENSEQFSKFEEGILSGSLTDVLKAAKEADSTAFNKITESLLPTLQKIDGNAYGVVLTQVLKGACVTLWNAGKDKGDNEEGNRLRAAAQILHEFTFNTKQISPYKAQFAKVEGDEDPEKKKFSEERQQFFTQQLDVAVNDVTTKVKNITKSTIEQYLDTKNQMSDYVRSKAIEDIVSKVDQAVMEDERFKKILDRHWENSANSNFSEETKRKIRNTLLSKIKTVLPDIMKRVKAEALKGQASKVVREEVRDEKPLSRGRETSKSTNSNRSDKSEGKSKDGRGMSTYDFFGKD